VIGETMQSNAAKEALFTPEQIKQLADGYRGEASPRDPYINPLYADLTGLPPIYVQVGDQEVLLDDSRRLADRARQAGVEVRLDIFPETQHTFQMMAGRAPEADDAIRGRTRRTRELSRSTPPDWVVQIVTEAVGRWVTIGLRRPRGLELPPYPAHCHLERAGGKERICRLSEYAADEATTAHRHRGT
jgi:hypothetical protein